MGSSPFACILILIVVTAPALAAPTFSSPKLLGTFPFHRAGFASLARNTTKSEVKYNLLLSSFGIGESDVAVVVDIGAQLKDVSSIRPTSINTEMKWPNFLSGVPDQVLKNKIPYIAIPDGFLVPGKGKGSLTLQPLHGGPSHLISGTTGDWFYHMVQWVDMDKDGRLDALTCKTSKPLIGGFKGAMVWYSNPVDHSISKPWTEHQLALGPDVLFTHSYANLSGIAKEIIVTAEYFNPRVRIFWTENPKQDWSQASAVKSRDIDHISKEQGAPFDVVVADVNNDGNPDIVLTLNQAKNGTVVIYESPADFRTGTFKRHVVASGYATEKGGPNSGAPGIFEILHGKDVTQKPSILVAGDDSGIVSILDPVKPKDPKDWQYKRTDILHTKSSRTGTARAADVDGDGRLEIFASSYEEGLIYVYRV